MYCLAEVKSIIVGAFILTWINICARCAVAVHVFSITGGATGLRPHTRGCSAAQLAGDGGGPSLPTDHRKTGKATAPTTRGQTTTRVVFRAFTCGTRPGSTRWPQEAILILPETRSPVSNHSFRPEGIRIVAWRPAPTPRCRR